MISYYKGGGWRIQSNGKISNTFSFIISSSTEDNVTDRNNNRPIVVGMVWFNKVSKQGDFDRDVPDGLGLS